MPGSQVNHSFTVSGVSGELRVEELEGSEGLSQLYAFEVTVACADLLSFDELAGKPAALKIQVEADDQPRFVHGIVSRVVNATAALDNHGYVLTLVPKVWRLLHRADARIFQMQTVGEVIQKVLEGGGLASGDDFRLNLQATYPQREYCVQYRERDWDFVCRLLEENGIRYFFEQNDEREVLVFADALRSADVPVEATLRFRPSGGALGSLVAHEQVTRFVLGRDVRPGKVTLRDYNFQKPALNLQSSKQAEADHDLEIYDYPGDYDLPGDGDALVGVRLGELRASRTAGDGDSGAAQLLPGHCFTLEEHPVDELNRRYLVTRVDHFATAHGEDSHDDAGGEPDARPLYANRFEVVPADVLYRPPRLTRKPLLHGVQTAVVVGPEGEEVHVDGHGRIKVQFFWDRLGKKDDKSSCWIRVSQPWAGSSAYGVLFLPRIHDEVVVTFLEGDPDRPLVVGSVYHGTNVPPYTLPDEKTKSTIKSNSSKGGGGFNELRFEDKKGSEEVYLHGQKDWNVKIEHDHTENIGHDETRKVENDRKQDVGHDQTLSVGNDETAEIKHDRKTKVDNDDTLEVGHDRTTTVKNDDTETVDGNQTLSVKKDRTNTVSGADELTVDKTQKLKVGEDATQTFQGALTVDISKDRKETVTGALSLTVRKGMTIEVTDSHSLSADSSSHSVKQKFAIEAEQEVDIKCGASKITIKADGTIQVEGVQMKIKCQGPAQIEAANVDLKAQGVAKIESSGLVNIKGSGPISVDSDAMVKIGGTLVAIG
jgi:type VI secretion system secreted protein VgrG